MKNEIRLLLSASLALLFVVENGLADVTTTSGIQTQGDSVLELSPEILRLSVDLSASGETMADASKKMKGRRLEAEKHLTALGAVKDSWKFSEVRFDLKKMRRRKHLHGAVENPEMNGGHVGKGKTAGLAAPVDLTVKLSADWKIEGSDAEEKLASIQKLRTAIEETDIGGVNDPDELDEEEDLLVSGAGNGPRGITFIRQPGVDGAIATFDENGQQIPGKTGKPTFLFVAPVSPSQRQKAIAEAFNAAKNEAQDLATAANVQLGEIKQLQLQRVEDVETSTESGEIDYSQFLNTTLQRRSQLLDPTREASSTTAGLLKYKVTIQATFAIK